MKKKKIRKASSGKYDRKRNNILILRDNILYAG